MLLLPVLFLFAQGVFAQTAALKIINHSTCTVYVNMYAIDANLGNGTACDIRVCLTIPPGPPVTFANPYLIPLPDYCTMTTPITLADLYTEFYVTLTPNWNWTDCEFQYDCGDCGTGGAISETYPGGTAACAINCVGTGSESWIPNTCSPPIVKAVWSSPGNCVMNNVQIDFINKKMPIVTLLSPFYFKTV